MCVYHLFKRTISKGTQFVDFDQSIRNVDLRMACCNRAMMSIEDVHLGANPYDRYRCSDPPIFAQALDEQLHQSR